MSERIESLKLNKENTKKYKTLNFSVFLIIFIFFIYMAYRVIFPSQYFTYSFNNVNSLKNTITDLSRDNNRLSFFASTPLNFSHVKISLDLEKNISTASLQKIEVQKSYKAFFYPLGEQLDDLDKKKENTLISIDDSVYVVGNNKKTPIDSTETFQSLGYKWENISENQEDLSNYEKQKLADLNATHPDGTILKTTENGKLYFIENQTKREIINSESRELKNSIEVNQKSLELIESCQLEKQFLTGRKYYCTLPISELNNLLGKDYKFNLNGISPEFKIRKIDLEFKKVSSWNNFDLFLSDLKKKILYRFGIKEA